MKQRRDSLERTQSSLGPWAAPLLLALVAWLAPFQVAAQAAAQVAAAKSADPRRPVFLWEVRSQSATVYLMGSIHVASGDAYPLDARIEHVFQAADTLVLETEMDESAQVRVAALMRKAGTYTPPDSLEHHIDAPTLARLSKSLSGMGLPLEAFMSMRPWMVSLTLTLARLQALGYRPELGIDQHFRSTAAGKKLLALETLDEQVALFRDMPESMQSAALRQSLDDLEDLHGLMQRAFEAWREGDASALEKLLVAPIRTAYPDLYRRLFVERNRRMADAVETYLKSKGTYFVVVGSGHLVGSDSVLHLLQSRGRKTRQL